MGVNGSEHPSERWRQTLPKFGFDLDKPADGSRLRRTLRLHDALTRHPIDVVAEKGPEFLAGDLFGPIISQSLARALGGDVSTFRLSPRRQLPSPSFPARGIK